MCGRYVRKGDKQKLAEHFHAQPNPAKLAMPDADYNVAPTTQQPIIRQSRESGEREMVLARWGLIPFFTKDLSKIKGLSTINARAESITKASTWREPMKKRRCIIPAHAFYEWGKAGKPPKQPYAFELSNGNPIGFAGLWDAWKDKGGHWLQSFAIVTTEANELMAPIHPRMPVILHPRDYDRWLDREETERLPIDLLRPFESDEFSKREVEPLARELRERVHRWVGIPTCVGIAPTKTLAKVANFIAKKRPQYRGVFDLRSASVRAELLHTVPVDEVWGIG